MKISLRSTFRRLIIVSGVVLGLVSQQPFLYSAWVQPPTVVSAPGTDVDNDEDAPVMVVNGQGNAISVWIDDIVGIEFDTVISSFFTPGTGWTPQTTISDTSLAPPPCTGPLYIFQFNPDIAMNASNYAVAVWEANLIDCVVFPNVIVSATSTNGVWNPVVIVALDPTGNLIPKQANVSVNDAGTALAAWRTFDPMGGTYVTTVSFLPLGGSWTPLFSFPLEFAIDTLSKPSPVINPSGNAVVAWEFEAFPPSPDVFGINAATYNAATGTWTGPVALDTTPAPFTSQISTNPRSAMDKNGNAVVIWQLNAEVKVAFFNGTSWEPAITLGAGSQDLDTVDVVMDPSGNATAVWQGPLPDNFILFSSRLPDGTWTAPQVIGQSDSSVGFAADLSHEPLAVNPVGDVIASWYTNGLTALQAAIKPFGQSWLPAEFVVSGVSGQIFNNNVGIDSCGLAIALWGVTPLSGFSTIQATINESFVKAPLGIKGKRCCDSFAMQKKCVNILEWLPNCPAASYNIYRNGVLIGNVPAGKPLKFVDPVGCKYKKQSYTITTVNAAGFESAPMPVIF